MESLDKLIEKYIQPNTVDWDALCELAKDFKKYDDGAHAKMIYQDKETIILVSKLSTDAMIPVHDHDCEEYFHVVRGFVKENISKMKLANGQGHLIKTGIPHQHEAIEDSLVLVMFSRQ